jgi:hypothetical protein
MPPTTDYIRHAARLARKVQLDAALGGARRRCRVLKALAKASRKSPPDWSWWPSATDSGTGAA